MALPPPRVDRHTHLEGSLDPGWVRREAASRGLTVPDVTEAFWRGEAHSFEAFIGTFVFACGFLTSRASVQAALEAAILRLPPPGAQAPRGIDLWISPHWLVRERQQITLNDLWRGLEAGLAEGRAQGVRIAVIIDAVNHFGPDHGHEVLDLVLEDLPPWVVGFSTGGLEKVPFRQWAPVFERARKAGLRLAAHAGENGPASGIREAILEAGVQRIVHGVKAGEDPAILELLVERQIPVDVCLTSNHALIPGLTRHPLPRFLAAGVRCGLGTDDPGVMRCDLPGEWDKALNTGLSLEAAQRLRDQSAEDAWSLQIGT
ncbi:MAG: add [Holophagaceae bacterium]|nr:add [Holophagaceae bacterium]